MKQVRARCHEVRTAARIYAREVAAGACLPLGRYLNIEHLRHKPTPAEAAAIEHELAAPPGSLFPPEAITPAKWSRKPCHP